MKAGELSINSLVSYPKTHIIRTGITFFLYAIKCGVYKIWIQWKKVVSIAMFLTQMLSISQATNLTACFRTWAQRFASFSS